MNSALQSTTVDQSNTAVKGHVCIACKPFFLNALKGEHEYTEIQNMFKEKNKPRAVKCAKAT